MVLLNLFGAYGNLIRGPRGDGATDIGVFQFLSGRDSLEECMQFNQTLQADPTILKHLKQHADIACNSK